MKKIMATIKSYTDLSQSKKLAEILPLESADMVLPFRHPEKDEYIPGYVVSRNYMEVYNEMIKLPLMKKEDVCQLIQPAWSLAALLSVLPMITKGKDTANPFIAKTPDNEYYVVYATFTKEVDSSAIYDNPIDVCYEMIIYLHELNLL